MYKFIKKNKLIITCILAIYVIFMLRYFKTKYSFAHPLSDFSDAYFKHPGQTKKFNLKFVDLDTTHLLF